ncbi:MAG: hypothetical protein J6Q38_00120 [Clostridia bacterium]|nr:hypothetical protein [Clostridia bacterium]
MTILSFDIESTTGNHRDGSMCTFGYCLADEKFNILRQEDIVMNPKTKRFETKIKLHYDKAFIKKQERFPAFYETVNGLFNDKAYVIGFSVLNDVEFLNNACEVYGLKKIDYDFLDVQLLYKTVYKKPTLSGLQVIAEELNIDYKAHRSDEDARVTLLLLKHIVEDLKMPLSEILRKFHITLGSNKKGEVVPCTNGELSKREINYLILKFVEKNYRHSRRYKGGLSFKTFAFTEEIRYGDIDKFRRIIKRVYDLNGRIGTIESSNVFVNSYKEGELPEKYINAINLRNKGKERIKVISEEEFLETLKELPELDFSKDGELLRVHRSEIKLSRERKRIEKRKQLMQEKANKKTVEKNEEK